MAYGRPNMGGMSQKQMMKQAQKLQEQMMAAQAKLMESEFTASTGGGAVKVTVTGDLHLKALTIDPEAVDPEDIEMLSDLITAAVNEAIRTANTDKEETMGKISGGMNLGGFGGLF